MLRSSSLTSFLLCTFLGTAAASTAWGACDRACLKNSLDQYLKAVVAHKPESAALSVGFRQTENATVTLKGAGLWASAKAIGKLDRRYYDVAMGEAAFFGLIDEAAGPAIATLRLKVEDNKISEAEWVLSRKNDPGIGPGAGNQAEHAYYDPDYLLAHVPPTTVIPKNERLSRSELVAITNSYFDGLSAHSGKMIIAKPGCTRIENGVLTTQRPIEGSKELTDCTGEGAMRNIFAVTARRYAVVDEEAGAVLGLGLFQRFPDTLMRRNLLAEWFFIEGTGAQASIRTIYASMFYPAPEAMVPNWAPYDGNWPAPLAGK